MTTLANAAASTPSTIPTVAGEVPIEWYVQKPAVQALDNRRQAVWARLYTAWKRQRSALEAAYAVAKALKRKGAVQRKQALTALAAHEKALIDLRARINAKFDSLEKKLIDKGVDATPEHWLNNRHDRTYLHPARLMGQLMPLAGLRADQAELTAAALQCGLGLFAQSGSPGWLARQRCIWHDEAFARAWLLRKDYALAHLDFSNGPPSLQAFTEFIETTDKAGISFVLGSLCCYLAAQEWLCNKQRSMRGFFHFKLYSQALVSGHDDFFDHREINAEGSTPDFLALDDLGQLYTFEAKGRKHSQRYSALKNGLLQIRAAPQSVALMERGLLAKLAPVLNGFAVCTSVEPRQVLRVLAYDPPAPESYTLPEGFEAEDPAHSQASNTPRQPPPPPPKNPPQAARAPQWRMLPALALGMALLQMEALFNQLPAPEERHAGFGWKNSGDTWLAIHRHSELARLDEVIRNFQYIRALLPIGLISTHVDQSGEVRTDWRARLLRKPGFRPEVLGELNAQRLRQAVQASEKPADVLVHLAVECGLDNLVSNTYLIISVTTQWLRDDNPQHRLVPMPGGLLMLAPGSGGPRTFKLPPAGRRPPKI